LKYKNFLTRTCSRQLRKREVWSLLFVFFFPLWEHFTCWVYMNLLSKKGFYEFTVESVEGRVNKGCF
jgi:hypothetical protein